jgi:hypothetical protein
MRCQEGLKINFSHAFFPCEAVSDEALSSEQTNSRDAHHSKLTAHPSGGNVEFVMFEDVHGKEVFVNPKRVMWVREYGDQNTEISCGADDRFSVRLSPAQAVAALGVSVR